jgi:hydrogenase nickel incorporation protein HypA/HybF
VHELSIADCVVNIACRHAGGRRVVQVELKVGHMRQVVPSALAFAFELVAQGTVAEGADLVMDEVSAAGICRDCRLKSALPDFPLRCTRCGGFEVEVTEGEELLVESLELEEINPKASDEALTTNAETGVGGPCIERR